MQAAGSPVNLSLKSSVFLFGVGALGGLRRIAGVPDKPARLPPPQRPALHPRPSLKNDVP